MSKSNIPFKTAYGPRSEKEVPVSDLPSLTKQAFKNECDVNTIMSRWMRVGGPIAPDRVGFGTFGDFTDVPDYQAAMNIVIQAEESFMSLPAKVRSRFSNDPAQFVSFCSDPANKDELISLGLVTPSVSAAEAVILPDPVDS